jgi:hypothetical protein
MPINKTIKISFLSALFATVAIMHTVYRSGDTTQSQPPYKSMKRTLKLMAPIEIKVVKQEQKETEAGDILTLIGTIRADQSLEKLRWEWRAAHGVEILDVTTVGYIDSMHAGEERTLQIRVRQLSQKNELVHLQVFQNESRSQLMGAFSYNTFDQEKLEAESAAIIERQREYHEELEGQTVLSSEAEKKNQAYEEHEH